MEELMAKSIVTVAAAVSILSLGSLVSAQAGGATSAPSKYNSADRDETAYRTSASHLAAYVALMDGNSDPPRLPMPPGTSSDHRSALEPCEP
jgi:hypothetical protein